MVGNLCRDHLPTGWRQVGGDRLRRDLGCRSQLDVGGGDQLSGYLLQAFARQQVERPDGHRRLAGNGRRAEHRVAGELRVPLPAQDEVGAGEQDRVVRAVQPVQADATGSVFEALAFACERAVALRVYTRCEMQCRRHQGRRRAGMELVAEQLAQRMLREIGTRLLRRYRHRSGGAAVRGAPQRPEHQSDDGLLEFTAAIAFGHPVERDDLDPARLAGGTEGLVAGAADLLYPPHVPA